VQVIVVGGSTQLGGLLLWRLIGQRKIKSIVAIDSIPPGAASPKLKWTIAHPTDPGLERHCEGADALIYAGFVAPGPDTPASAGARIVIDAAKVAIPALVGVSSCIASDAADDSLASLDRALDEVEAGHPSVRVVRLRPAFLIGREMPGALGASLRRRSLPKAGEHAPPVVWDEDVADAAVLALSSDARGAFDLAAEPSPGIETLVAAGGMHVAIPRTVLDGRSRRLSALFTQMTRGLPTDHPWMKATRERVAADTERARNELGWKPSCATAEAVMSRFGGEVPHRLDRRIVTFLRMTQAAARRFSDEELSPEARRIDITVHLRLSGKNGGDFTLRTNYGKPQLKRGIPRPLDAVISLSADTLLEMLSGKLDLATARFGGQVLIQGEPLAGFVIMALVTNFRRVAAGAGARAWTARRLERWFARGTP
jgi:UDP-glucose 4-epimerase